MWSCLWLCIKWRDPICLASVSPYWMGPEFWLSHVPVGSVSILHVPDDLRTVPRPDIFLSWQVFSLVVETHSGPLLDCPLTLLSCLPMGATVMPGPPPVPAYMCQQELWHDHGFPIQAHAQFQSPFMPLDAAAKPRAMHAYLPCTNSNTGVVAMGSMCPGWQDRHLLPNPPDL